MAMFRLRRYRVLLGCAFVVTVLLYHVAQNSSRWDSSPELWHTKTHPHARPGPESPPSPPPHRGPEHAHDHDHDDPERKPNPPGAAKPQKPKHDAPPPPPPPEHPSGHDQPAPKQKVEEEPTIRLPKLKTSNGVKGGYSLPTRAPVPPKPAHDGTQGQSQEQERIHWVDPPARLEEDAVPTTTIVHWEKPSEWFPVPEESLIMLPTGKPMPMPSVQFAFANKESAETKEKRELRLAKVKAEAQRAWSGYKKYAWTHDEIMPVSMKPKDPFCGWAATLVDALDTLWIMGMKEEFDDAVEAVKEIDFTTTPYREDIPVFETIIRYLGGLVGAYDVAGGHDSKYQVLLDKAVELAEILMGVFDTPNRMPILYYNWKPAFNVNAERASASAGVAELGSMSMEFTRLAQLTGKHKYYDAIARITDGLEDLQNRENGTAIPGIFPEHIDATGCNRSAPLPSTLDMSSTAAQSQADTHADLSDGTIKAVQGPANKGSGGSTSSSSSSDNKASQGAGAPAAKSESEEAHSGLRKRGGPPTMAPAPFTAQGLPADWECVPQGLTSGGWGAGSYSMGGSQDSTYEYFPKQFVLLGGLVSKYRAMHEKVADAVTKYLLFRPMAEGDPDILFSAKAYGPQMNSENLSYQYEVTHLTCFLGGMFGLGGKLFDRPEDVEIGKKLADGCVWAYEVMPTGIMPEYAMVLPCQSRDNCHWNQDAWYAALDPMKAERKLELEQYEKRRAQWEREVDDLKAHEALRKQAAEQKRQDQEQAKKERRKAQQQQGSSAEPKPEEDARPTGGLQKRDPAAVDLHAANEERFQQLQSGLELGSGIASQGGSSARQDSYRDASNEQELDLPEEPTKPLTHEQFVKKKIRDEHIPAGFVSLNDKRYILRPEAIESVWYMYRITGDTAWQDKGWRMFEAVARATRTEAGHSAIRDVTAAGAPVLEDSMESFWLAETLKYFYLLFAEPDVISLDEWVLNTEAHPFRRPT